MPTIKESAFVNRNRVVSRPTSGEPPQRITAGPEAPTYTSPFFTSSLPAVASNYDLYRRQFWGTSSMKKSRILPVNL